MAFYLASKSPRRRELLKDAGFDGAVLIEVYAGDYKDYIELKRSCDYLDEILYKIG